VTWGSVVLGLLDGLTIGLLAVGLVLVYKANRFLNLAHGQMGTVSAMLLGKFILDWHWPWWIAFGLSIPVGIAIGYLVDRVVISPLRRRTKSTVSLLLATIGVTQILVALAYIPALGPNNNRLRSKGYPLPFHPHWRFGGVILGGQHLLILIVVPALVLALAAFMRFAQIGKMIRAVATNPEAARLCGISLRQVSMVTWLIAGGLAAVTAVLQAPSQATFDAPSLGPELLLLALGAAVVGRFVSITGSLVGGIVIGLIQQRASSEAPVRQSQEPGRGRQRRVIF
jgi:branched-subunit amino acid ABC-type transport system permease component